MPYNIVLEPKLRERLDARAKALGMRTAAFLRLAAVEKLEREDAI